MSQPEWIYKIFPSATADSRFYFPTPIPASHQFFLNQNDLEDGFVHMSTAKQVPGVLNKYFADADQVAILRIETARLSAWKTVTWDRASDGQTYPHLRAHLEGENIDSFKELEKGQSWDEALKSIADWLQ